MKISSIDLEGESVYGYLDDGVIRVPKPEFLVLYPDLKSVLAAEAYAELASTDIAETVSITEAVFEPLIPNPGRIFCVGINFLAHMKEMGREPPDYPWLFTRFADSQVGHGQPMLRPPESEKFDFEGELAVVIGKVTHRVKAADALDYVAGYSCFNDGSIRDYQRHSTQFTAGKNFYHSGSFGPWLVTTDEIPDPTALNLETRLNGEVMQQAPINDLKFDIPALIEYCSIFCRLQPGDVISTGTPGGVGFARTPPVWLKPGDTIEVEIDGIGVLENPIVDYKQE
ncbi:MAG: fumarylacetoacetate hydrolase family protein [Gammaproteobacteria bacterium]|jgi:2-keto-4-pentenoate hydratase/2-oxohepta-3-ene-1,7-dioic acid hydratase in catechol pathway|nr:fumarylacetoacetate hydrolase family protein [Gammaproteobacteria bacterium]MDP6617556.1 fumarylacetoacetate hydrolase family protein [Gammaproteobacteria bacterium]MDP6694433.1 fumarylacetoacetate hydrolase family protein [Gammaproteobacteria bacterium]MDP7042304.1 fumarylacetoacetate hydrolase family protein [Gammaproteobacteria bacterium]